MNYFVACLFYKVKNSHQHDYSGQHFYLIQKSTFDNVNFLIHHSNKGSLLLNIVSYIKNIIQVGISFALKIIKYFFTLYFLYICILLYFFLIKKISFKCLNICDKIFLFLNLNFDFFFYFDFFLISL